MSNNNYFRVFQPTEPLQYKSELQNYDISDWAESILPSGNILVKDSLAEVLPIESYEENEPEIKEEIPVYQEPKQKQTKNSKVKVSTSKGANRLSQYIDEVSNEPGYEGLKDPETKRLLMLQAQRESNYIQNASNGQSSAVGYFQFIDSTRQRYSKVSKKDFINNAKEQVRTAYKYLRDIFNTKQARQLSNAGYNDALIAVLGWWYPRSMQMVLDGKRNFSLGGFSIQKAFDMYGS